MEKKKKITMGSTLLVVAMISLVGVGFALTLSGSATTTNNQASSEYILVELDNYNGGFLSGTYTVDTSNNGTNVSLTTLRNGDSVIAAGNIVNDMFAYSGGFTITDTSSGYSAYKVGSVEATITTPASGSSVDAVDVAISGTPTSVVNQYGLSLVYVKDGAIFNPASGISDLDVQSGSGTFTIDAYLVFSESVPIANIGSINAFTLANSTITFTATPAA